jgi:hypothetical protein
MSYSNVGALTPSRPAPPAPQRRGTENSLANVGYNLSNLSLTSSGAGSTYSSQYSGIGGSPARQLSNDTGPTYPGGVVRQGTVNVKEEGFASFLWRPKWLVLNDTQLTLHKNEVRPGLCSLLLRPLSALSPP